MTAVQVLSYWNHVFQHFFPNFITICLFSFWFIYKKHVLGGPTKYPILWPIHAELRLRTVKEEGWTCTNALQRQIWQVPCFTVPFEIRNGNACDAHSSPWQKANTEGLKDWKSSGETWQPLLLTGFPSFPGATVRYLPAGAVDSDCPLVQGWNLLNNLKEGDSYKQNIHLQLNGEPALARVLSISDGQGDFQVVFQMAHWPWTWGHFNSAKQPVIPSAATEQNSHVKHRQISKILPIQKCQLIVSHFRSVRNGFWRWWS